MIEHESDLWPVRRWAVEVWPDGEEHAEPFMSDEARSAWVAKSPRLHLREPVGKRHPAVKAVRQAWRTRALNARTF